MNINNIFKKLNIAEQMQLNNYLNQEISKACMKMTEKLHEEAEEQKQAINKAADDRENLIAELNEHTWSKLWSWTEIAMRRYKISMSRCDAIGEELQRIINENKQEEREKRLLINRLYKEYAVLTEEELRILIEWSLEAKCKNCCGKTNCEVRQLYKQFDIAEFNAEKYCEYAYKKNKKGKVL